MSSSSSDRMQTDEQPSKYLFRFDKDIKFDSAKESYKLLTINGEYNFISRELIQDFLIRNIKTIASTTIKLSELKMKKQDIYKIYCIQSMVISFTRIKNSFEGIGSFILKNINTISDEQLKSDVIAIYKYFFSDDIDINKRLKDVTKELCNVDVITKITFNDDLIPKLERFKKALVLFLIIVNNTINSNKYKYKCSQCDKKNFTLEIYKHNFNSQGNNECILKTYHSSSYSDKKCYMIGFFDLYNIQFNIFDASDRNIIIIKQKEGIDIPVIENKNYYDNYNTNIPKTTEYALHKTGYLECDTVTMNVRDEAEKSTCTIEDSLIKTHEYILTANEHIPIIKLSFTNTAEKDYDILNYILEQLSSTIRTEYCFLESDIATDYIKSKIPNEFKKIFLETYTTPSIDVDCKCKNICIKFTDENGNKLSFQNIKDIMIYIETDITNITTSNVNEYIKRLTTSTQKICEYECDDDCDDDCDNGEPPLKRQKLDKEGGKNKYYLNKYIKYKMKYINLKNELDLSNHF